MTVQHLRHFRQVRVAQLPRLHVPVPKERFAFFDAPCAEEISKGFLEGPNLARHKVLRLQRRKQGPLLVGQLLR